MIFKVAAVLAVLFLVYILFFKKGREKNIKDRENISDEMTECASCGTFVSKDEAILSNSKYYCSKECLK